MEFRKAHIRAARFEVMKVFVLQMKKKKILRQKSVTFSCMPTFSYHCIRMYMDPRCPAQTRKLHRFIPWDHKEQIRSTIPFLTAPAWVGKDAAAHWSDGPRLGKVKEP